MTRPKGKLFALLAIFAAIGIITATGAFTSVQADRTVTATVENDTTAILGLTPYDGSNGNGGAADTSSNGYAKIDGTTGVLQINLGKYSGGSPVGNGLNYNATTEFDNVFNVSNNGPTDIQYYITRNGEDANADNAVIFYEGQATTGTNVTGTANSAASSTLTPGDRAAISIAVDLTGVDASDVSEGQGIIDGITIHADSV